MTDFADLVLDTGAPVGDAAVEVPGLTENVSPLSTVGGVILVNAIKAEVAAQLTAEKVAPQSSKPKMGCPPPAAPVLSVVAMRMPSRPVSLITAAGIGTMPAF